MFSNCTFPTNSTFIKSIHLQPATQHSQSNSLNSPGVHILAVILLKCWRPLMELWTYQNVKSKNSIIIQMTRRGLWVFVHQMLLRKQCRDNRERSEVSFQTNNETFLKVKRTLCFAILLWMSWERKVNWLCYFKGFMIGSFTQKNPQGQYLYN